MPEPVDGQCKGAADHHRHICQLRKQGQLMQVKTLMAEPGHRCLNCNAVANNVFNLCNPIPFSKV